MRRVVACFFVGLAAGCSEPAPPPPAAAELAAAQGLQQRLLDAKPGDVIEIPAGRYALERGLSLRVDGVTLRGAGADRTILSFKPQLAGPEGLLVHADDFTIEHLAIEDSKGDGLKVNAAERVTIRGVRVEWTGGPQTANGAYGIYPVKCRDVLIEDSVAIGASDAGIYVGQSRNVVVRRNRAERNVAGIEIENTVDADVYENVATGNTGGILVFNMPNLPEPGHTVRVFKNRVVANNTANFAAEGSAVSSVPAGAGVVVNANPRVEIFDNDIADNRTANVIVSSYFSTGFMNKYGIRPDYDPYPRGVYVHDNRFSGGGDAPDGLDLKTLKLAMFGVGGRLPDILWDGYVDPKSLVDGRQPDAERLCVRNGDAEVLNADGPNDYANPSTDMTAHRCELPPLPAVALGRG